MTGDGRGSGTLLCVAVVTLSLALPAIADAQETRAEEIAAKQREKAQQLAPYQPNGFERAMTRIEANFASPPSGFFPAFNSIYSGGGFTLGGGYRRFFERNAVWDVVGLYSIKNYKQIEVGTRTPWHGTGKWTLGVRAGWLDAPQVGYFGRAWTIAIDPGQLPAVARLCHALGDRPAEPLDASGGERSAYDAYETDEGHGRHPSIETIYDARHGAGAVRESDVHAYAREAAIDWRPVAGYARKGGFYGVTFANYADRDDTYSFQRLDGEIIQHLPILRENWVISLRGRVQTTLDDDDMVPYFLLPQLGSGRTLRGYSTGRFRDRHSLLTSAEFRWIPNRLGLDMALFYDAGKVATRREDLDFNDLATDWGIGARFHGPTTTVLRIEVARGLRGLAAGLRRPARRSNAGQSRIMIRAPVRFALLGRPRAGLRHWSAAVVPRPAVAGAAPEVLLRRSARSASPRRRTPRRSQEWDIGLPPDLLLNLFSRPGDPASERPRAEHQHDRRGAGLELVHQPHLRARRVDRRDHARAQHDRRPAPGQVDRHPRQERRRGAGVHGPRREGRGVVRHASTARDNPMAPTAAVAVATRLFWALGYYQVESHLTSDAAARTSSSARRPRSARTASGGRCDPTDVERRVRPIGAGARTARIAWSPAARVAGPAGRRVQVLRHASRRSERRRAARAPPRAARAAGVRRVDQPRGHEGRQHARHGHHRERPRRRPPLPAGRRLDVRHRRARAARRRRRLRVSVRGRSAVEAALHARLLHQPVADARLTKSTPRSAASKGRQFEPEKWKPRVPVAALRHARPDDTFWAALRVMAFTDEQIRAAVKTGGLHRSGGGETARRRADRAARQDRPDVLRRGSIRWSDSR